MRLETEDVAVTHSGRYHGGLGFLGKPDCGLDRFSRIAAATLEAYGHRVERQSAQGPLDARITSSRFVVALHLDGAGPAPADRDRRRPEREDELIQRRLTISLCPAEDGPGMDAQAQLMLVVMLYRMVEAYGALSIEWLDPDTVLSVEQFLSAFAEVSPRRVRGRQEILDERRARFAPVDETARTLNHQCDAICGQSPTGPEGPVDLTEEEALALAFRDGPRPDEITDPGEESMSDIRRLATWGMTGTVAFISAPVAISLAAVNLARGEDFRLNTQVLAFAGLIAMLYNSGALTHAATVLPI